VQARQGAAIKKKLAAGSPSGSREGWFLSVTFKMFALEDPDSAVVHFTLFIHFRIGPVTDVSAVFGENTSDMWL